MFFWCFFFDVFRFVDSWVLGTFWFLFLWVSDGFYRCLAASAERTGENDWRSCLLFAAKAGRHWSRRVRSARIRFGPVPARGISSRNLTSGFVGEINCLVMYMSQHPIPNLCVESCIRTGLSEFPEGH